MKKIKKIEKLKPVVFSINGFKGINGFLLTIFLFRNHFSSIILHFQLKKRKKFPLISFTRCFEQISTPGLPYVDKKSEELKIKIEKLVNKFFPQFSI